MLNVSFLSSAEGTSEGTMNTSFYTILFSDNFVSLMCSLGAFREIAKSDCHRHLLCPPVYQFASPPPWNKSVPTGKIIKI
jgi:hypothetical protein